MVFAWECTACGLRNEVEDDEDAGQPSCAECGAVNTQHTQEDTGGELLDTIGQLHALRTRKTLQQTHKRVKVRLPKQTRLDIVLLALQHLLRHIAREIATHLGEGDSFHAEVRRLWLCFRAHAPRDPRVVLQLIRLTRDDDRGGALASLLADAYRAERGRGRHRRGGADGAGAGGTEPQRSRKRGRTASDGSSQDGSAEHAPAAAAATKGEDTDPEAGAHSSGGSSSDSSLPSSPPSSPGVAAAAKAAGAGGDGGAAPDKASQALARRVVHAELLASGRDKAALHRTASLRVHGRPQAAEPSCAPGVGIRMLLGLATLALRQCRSRRCAVDLARLAAQGVLPLGASLGSSHPLYWRCLGALARLDRWHGAGVTWPALEFESGRLALWLGLGDAHAPLHADTVTRSLCAAAGAPGPWRGLCSSLLHHLRGHWAASHSGGHAPRGGRGVSGTANLGVRTPRGLVVLGDAVRAGGGGAASADGPQWSLAALVGVSAVAVKLWLTEQPSTAPRHSSSSSSSSPADAAVRFQGLDSGAEAAPGATALLRAHAAEYAAWARRCLGHGAPLHAGQRSEAESAVAANAAAAAATSATSSGVSLALDATLFSVRSGQLEAAVEVRDAVARWGALGQGPAGNTERGVRGGEEEEEEEESEEGELAVGERAQLPSAQASLQLPYRACSSTSRAHLLSPAASTSAVARARGAVGADREDELYTVAAVDRCSLAWASRADEVRALLIDVENVLAVAHPP